MLGEDEALLEEFALMSMDPEDGPPSPSWISTTRVSTTAFTPFGIENLKELLADLKPNKDIRVAATQARLFTAAVLGGRLLAA